MESELTDINSRGSPHHASIGTPITVLGERGLNSRSRLPYAQSEGVRRSLLDKDEITTAPPLPPPHSCSASPAILNHPVGSQKVGVVADGSSRLPTRAQTRNKRTYSILPACHGSGPYYPVSAATDSIIFLALAKYLASSAPSSSPMDFTFPPRPPAAVQHPSNSTATAKGLQTIRNTGRAASDGASTIALSENGSSRYVDHLKDVFSGDDTVGGGGSRRPPPTKMMLSCPNPTSINPKIDQPTAAVFSENVLPVDPPSHPRPSIDSMLQCHLLTERHASGGPVKRITHRRTGSSLSLASVTTTSSIHGGTDLPNWEQFEALPRDEESYTSFPKYESNRMRSSSLMRIGAKFIGEDHKPGVIRGLLSKVWTRKDRTEQAVYRPSTLVRSSSLPEEEEEDPVTPQIVASIDPGQEGDVATMVVEQPRKVKSKQGGGDHN